VARAAGRAEQQPVRVTSALKKGPRATSAEPAETSGVSCRTSQEPVVPRDERARDDRTRYGSCRDDRRHYGSCRRVRRPDALRKLSARETIALKKGPRATSAISEETSAERDQWRELPDEPSTSRSA
jgi:hypothetical protein